MNIRTGLISWSLLLCLFFLASSANTQLPPPSLGGALYIHVPNSPQPIPASGYQVFLYRREFGWSMPSFTDSYGRYAHYGVRPGTYLMRVVNRYSHTVWQQEVVIPSQLPPIVLPRP